MSGLVEGAALGAAFDLLFISVLAATQKVVRFSSDLNRLSQTLASIKPIIDDIDNFNRILARPPHETQAFTAKLIEGEKLIKKCSKVKYWNVFKRWYYSTKLSKLEGKLLNFFQIDVAAFHFLETKRILVAVGDLGERMNEMTIILNESSSDRVGGAGSNGFEEIEEGGINVVEIETDDDEIFYIHGS